MSGSRRISGRAAFESRNENVVLHVGFCSHGASAGSMLPSAKNDLGRAVKYLQYHTRAAQLPLPFDQPARPPSCRNTHFAAAWTRPSSGMQHDIITDACEPWVTPSCPAKTAGEKRLCAHSKRRFKGAKRRELAVGCGAARFWRSTRES